MTDICKHCGAPLKAPGVHLTPRLRQIFDALVALKGPVQNSLVLKHINDRSVFRMSEALLRSHVGRLRIVLDQTPYRIVTTYESANTVSGARRAFYELKYIDFDRKQNQPATQVATAAE